MTEYPLDKPCPCKSGRMYKQCCHGKSFKWLIAPNGEIKRSFPLSTKMIEVVQHERQRYKSIFGRAPGHGDRLLVDTYLITQEDWWNSFCDSLELPGVRPELIYATRKTGLMVTEFNIDLLPERDLEEWHAAIREFRKKKAQPRPSFRQRRFDAQYKLLKEEFQAIQYVFGKLIHDFHDAACPAEDTVLFIRGHLLFCAARTVKTLQASAVLFEGSFGEDALNLSRSVYENYLNSVYAITHGHEFEKILMAQIGLTDGTNSYLREDGRINARIIVDGRTGERIKSRVSVKVMAKSSPFPEDMRIYELLYSHLSHYTHAHINAMGDYVGPAGISSIYKKSALEPAFFSLFFATLVLETLGMLPGITRPLNADALRVSKRIAARLRKFLQLKPLPPLCNAVLAALDARLARVGKPWPGLVNEHGQWVPDVN